jgi:hypothetical protein
MSDPILRAAYKEWVSLQELRWAQRAENFWDEVVESMERMFFNHGIEFWSELSRTRSCLWLVMRLENNNSVRIGSMSTRLVDGLYPVVSVKFDFSCLDDVLNIWNAGISSVRGLMRCVDVVPEIGEVGPFQSVHTESVPLVWKGNVTVTCVKPRGASWHHGLNFFYTDNILHTHEMAKCLFQGGGDERMQWIRREPFRFHKRPTRRHMDQRFIDVGEKIFKTSIN